MRARIALVVAAVVALAVVVAALSLLTTSPSEANLAGDAPPPLPSSPAMEAKPQQAEAKAKKDAARGGGGGAVVDKFGARRVSCDAACAIEAGCGVRDVDACRKASCDDDVRKPSTSDFCFVAADDCHAAVVCSCEESCWKRGECLGDHAHDVECTKSCTVLAAQQPAALYRENRCVLESACADIAVCGALTSSTSATMRAAPGAPPTQP